MATINAINNADSVFTVATGNLTVTTGNISTSAGYITSATTLTATLGAITATAGNVVITSGNLTLPTTSSTVGQILVNSILWAHSFGTGNVFIGATAGNTAFNATYNYRNVGIGDNTLKAIAGGAASEGSEHVAIGFEAGKSITTGRANTLIGCNCGAAGTSLYASTFVGFDAGSSITTGIKTEIFGAYSGSGYVGDESYNILIGSDIPGVAGEDNVLRIGAATGTGAGKISVAYICGITGKTSTSGAAVYVNSSNVLGTSTSNRDSKFDIADMGEDSAVIYNLRPRTFKFKADTDPKPKSFGMIAEEVEPVFPEMVLYDNNGNPWNLSYQFLAPMLVNELQKLEKRVAALEALNEPV